MCPLRTNLAYPRSEHTKFRIYPHKIWKEAFHFKEEKKNGPSREVNCVQATKLAGGKGTSPLAQAQGPCHSAVAPQILPRGLQLGSSSCPYGLKYCSLWIPICHPKGVSPLLIILAEAPCPTAHSKYQAWMAGGGPGPWLQTRYFTKPCAYEISVHPEKHFKVMNTTKGMHMKGSTWQFN